MLEVKIPDECQDCSFIRWTCREPSCNLLDKRLKIENSTPVKECKVKRMVDFDDPNLFMKLLLKNFLTINKDKIGKAIVKLKNEDIGFTPDDQKEQ